MQGLRNEADETTKMKRRQLTLGVFLIILMVGSTAGFAFSLIANSNANTPLPAEEGPVFDGSRWIVTQGSMRFALTHSPEDVSTITVPPVAISDFTGKEVYIDASDSLILQEVGGVLYAYAGRLHEACYGACPERDVPEKGCDVPLVVWRASTHESVRKEQQCIFIEGSTKAADAFLYTLLGY